MATIHRYYFQVCTQGARRRGADIDALLRNAGIAPSRLSEPGWRGEVAAMARLVRDIWSLLDDEFMGFTPTPMRRGAFAIALKLASGAPSVGEAIREATGFYNIATRDIRTETSISGDAFIATASFRRPRLDPNRYFAEFWMIIWHRLACWLAGETIPLLGAEFDYGRPDGYFEEFKYLFPCPHVFNTGDAGVLRIRMDRHAMESPVRRSADEISRMAAEAPLELMTIPASDHSFARRVRRRLSANMSAGMAEIADDLGVSADALRRTLRREGVGLSEIRENIRRDLATSRLAATNQSVEEIAAALGYAEARSFTRAFGQWTGLSPSQWRRKFTGTPAERENASNFNVAVTRVFTRP